MYKNIFSVVTLLKNVPKYYKILKIDQQKVGKMVLCKCIVYTVEDLITCHDQFFDHAPRLLRSDHWAS
jgi:hypothetical protein